LKISGSGFTPASPWITGMRFSQEHRAETYKILGNDEVEMTQLRNWPALPNTIKKTQVAMVLSEGTDIVPGPDILITSQLQIRSMSPVFLTTSDPEVLVNTASDLFPMVNYTCIVKNQASQTLQVLKGSILSTRHLSCEFAGLSPGQYQIGLTINYPDVSPHGFKSFYVLAEPQLVRFQYPGVQYL
jgi:hypothetical protein